MSYGLPALVAIFVMYGSLYPFDFASPAPNALNGLLSNWHLFHSRGDALGNIGLFVPWGVVSVLALAPRRGGIVATSIACALGFVLACVAQIGQLWVPARDPAAGDVVWNLVGCIIGVAIGYRLLAKRKTNGGAAPPALVGDALLGAWLLTEWLPLIPSLDVQLIKEHLKTIVAGPALNIGELAPQLAMTVLAGHLIRQRTERGHPVRIFFAILALVVAGKLIIIGAQASLSMLIGLALGAITWLTIDRVPRQRQREILAGLLLTGYTCAALSPFSFRDAAAGIVWLPFSAMLQGSMLANVQSLMADMVLFASILYVVQAAGGRPIAMSIILAMWVLGMESLQAFIETRTADITEPLLVLILGQVLAPALQQERRERQAATLPAPTSTEAAVTRRPAIRSPSRLALQIGVPTAVIVTAISAVLHLPGIPYNILELFRGNGNIAALTLFALTILWAGAGAVLLGRLLSRSRHPGLLIVPATLMVCLVSLSLLWSAVTTESIEDIAGSSNLFWFVTNRDIWGEAWRKIFLYLNDPDTIGLIEHYCRYSALYAPLPICLAYLLAVAEHNHHGGTNHRWLIELTLGMLLLMWLCKAVAFDWSSTDNLNELIARDGEWGLGGGGYLYLLLLLVCATGLGLGGSLAGTWWRRLLAGAVMLAALPVGWWLLNEGLERQVEKYDLVFSGVQFLLGPDRRHTLDSDSLFLRWSILQLSATLGIAVGIWIGNSAFPRNQGELPARGAGCRR